MIKAINTTIFVADILILGLVVFTNMDLRYLTLGFALLNAIWFGFVYYFRNDEKTSNKGC